jgi:hypothetical protein
MKMIFILNILDMLENRWCHQIVDKLHRLAYDCRQSNSNLIRRQLLSVLDQ